MFVNKVSLLRFRAAMRVSEGMQKEQASLIKQLDMLR